MYSIKLKDGTHQYIIRTKSGRKYRGATPEEAERKFLLSYLHAAAREYEGLRELCNAEFGNYSFGSLTLEQMRQLKSYYERANESGEALKESTRIVSEAKATPRQIAAIVKLGRYVIGERYGKNWFWQKCKEWIPRFNDAERINLNELTSYEAWYLIQRLEKIEKRLEKKVSNKQ
ncbi:MAG: hypothetical protein KBG83_00030 [Bacteroidetes bacterium]|nr:hypothetical protein [Bacteroidota bacterium]